MKARTKSGPFDGWDIISCYTWDDAVEDGTFVEVTSLAEKWGFNIPVAITQSVYQLCKQETDEKTSVRIVDLILSLYVRIKAGTGDNSMTEFKHDFVNNLTSEPITTVWATIEGRNPKNPEPVMTIMLPEDY